MQTVPSSQPTIVSQQSTPLIQVDDLHIHFRTPHGVARVVDGANLTINRGEIFGLAGESGSGKTTLVEAILQIVRFANREATGHIWFTPRDASTPVDLMTLSAAKLRRYRWQHLSYVPQGSMNSLNPVVRIADQIVEAMTAHGVDRSEARAKIPALLEKVGLEPRVARLYPHELSGGMRQRAIIATAIAMDPELIVADEPTTALDVNVQRTILETLLTLRRDYGVAILLVSHDLPVHAQLVDRTAIMYAGQVVEVGDVRSVLKNSLHPYTRGLMHSIPTVGGARLRIDGIAGVAPSPTSWPTGCRFHPRCPLAMPVCQKHVPRLAAVAAGDRPLPWGTRYIDSDRQVACHVYPESTVGELV